MSKINNDEQFHNFFDAIPCYVSIQDKSLRIFQANKKFKDDFGAKSGDFCYKVYKGREEPCYNCPVLACFKYSKVYQTEEIVTTKNGDQYNILTFTSPIYSENGKIEFVMEMSTDISYIRLSQSRLTALGLLLGSMSHGIRGLLTALDGCTYRLKSNIKKKDIQKIADIFPSMVDIIDRIQSMIMNILHYSKERKLQVEEIKAEKFLDEIVIIVKEKIKKLKDKKINFECSFEKNLGNLKIDNKSLVPAIVNLLENAVDACIDDINQNKKHKVEFFAKIENKNFILQIKDNGTGMNKDTQNNMFTLFFSSKGHRGTGFGLFIAKQTIEQHFGEIDVSSKIGSGSIFTIKLPIIK